MPEEIEVPTEQLQETMQETARERGARWMSNVAVSSALIAVSAAIASLLAGHHANEAMLEQMQASDTWAYFQAKGIKAAVLESKLQLLEAMGKNAPANERDKLTRYDGDKKTIEDQAHEKEESSHEHMARHAVLARSVTVYQIAIALAAIAVLVQKRWVWFLSVGMGVIGTGFLIQGIL